MAEQNTEAELESFRRQWQEEVRRGKKKQSIDEANTAGLSSSTRVPKASQRKTAKLKPSVNNQTVGSDDDVSNQTYHDPENKEDGLKLGSSTETRERATSKKEPTTALDHYERAVEREAAGNLGDSVTLYRKAFRV